MVDIESNKLHTYSLNKCSSIPIVFLHGFTGSSLTWLGIQEGINHYTISVDLPGHGKSKIFLNSSPLINFSNLLKETLSTLGIDKIHLCGYSMGGRLAIIFSSQYPDMVESIILESCSLGIKCEKERKKRHGQDARISKEIISDFSSFISRWECGDMFKYQKERNFSEWKIQRHVRLSHDKKNLSQALNVFGAGSINYLQKEFEEIKSPITIISGNEDVKYTNIALEMIQLNSNAHHVVIDDSAHNTHLENIDNFIVELNNHLSRMD